MSSPVRLASFCRLCLSKTKDKVPVFTNDNMLENLLQLIEIQIDPDDEADAVICYDCVVTLEGFHQFKEQCHVNDEFVKTVPAKLDGTASSVEDGEDEDDREGGFLEEEELEEEDRLELSEAEEVFQVMPGSPPKSNKKKNKKGKSPKKLPTPKHKKSSSKASTREKLEIQEKPAPKKTIDELQVLADSYPDFFYFEKGSRSIYYTMIFYGERYNSAHFCERSTTWQCVHRRRYQCPGQVWVTNDYKTFERRFEHTHGKLKEKEGQAFTPHEALPELFKICKRIVMEKKMKYPPPREVKSFEDKFQEFAADTLIEESEEDASSQTKESPTATDSDEETAVVSDSRPKRKIKPNARYSDKAYQPKKRAGELKLTPKKQAMEKSTEPKSKKRAVEKRPSKKPKPEDSETDDDEQEESVNDEEQGEDEEEEELDLDKIEEECEALNIPKRKAPGGPLLEDLQVLADSYPDYFFFEKGPRSIYFTLVYYGERFHSPLFTEHYTYWQCRHRRKYKCPAQVCAKNNYQSFERRHEHTHPDLPDKEGQAFTPLEALPELFESVRKVILKNRAKRRKRVLEKYKYLQSLNGSQRQHAPKTKSNQSEEHVVEVHVQVDDEDYDYDNASETERMLKDAEYVEELIEVTED